MTFVDKSFLTHPYFFIKDHLSLIIDYRLTVLRYTVLRLIQGARV